MRSENSIPDGLKGQNTSKQDNNKKKKQTINMSCDDKNPMQKWDKNCKSMPL